MDYKDYYNVLGVDKKATEKEIKSAFRKLARQCHPDMNPDDPSAESRFKDINEAYEVLSDTEKRGKYDHLGTDWRRWQHTGGAASDYDWGRWQAAPGGQRQHVQYGTAEDFADLFGGSSSFSDFFNSIFGESGRTPGQASGFEGFQHQPRPQRGQDLEHPVEISLAEAYHGTTRLLTKNGRRLEIKLPPGAKTGTKVRVRGEGGQSTNASQAGDLYLKIKVTSDPRFQRRGDNLHTTVPLDLYTAVLGGEASVPTLTNEVNLKIPPGSQNGQTFRLRGKGMPNLKKPTEHGDLYARIDVRLPADLTPKQRALFEELRRLI